MKNILLVLVLACVVYPLGVSATTHTVMVSDNFFEPSTVNVAVGDTVRWQWISGFHTTTCNPSLDPVTSLPAGAATWNAEMSSSLPVFSYRVTVAGTYQYVCMPHSPGMAGTINASGGGSLRMTENFDYPEGDSIGAHGWISFSGGATNYLAVTSPGLTFPGYPLSGIGNATTLTTTGQDAYKSMTASVSSDSVYAIYMVNVTSAQAGDYFTAFLPSTSTTLYTGRVFISDSVGSFKFGISKSTEAVTYSPAIYSYNTTYIVVLKYSFKTGTTTDDQISLYVFPSNVPMMQPSTPTVGPITGTAGDLANIGRIPLRQGTAGTAANLRVDGIMVSTAWADIVTGIDPATPTHIAGDFRLYQNYPNPFNPSTTISFAIPQSGFVNLRVYNMLGKEVSALVNNSLTPGTYNINFNAGNLNSGVYFYRLSVRTDNGVLFTDSKKLLLIK